MALEAEIEACKGAPEAARKKTVSFTRSQYDFPDNPTQKLEIEKIVERGMAGYVEIFKKIDAAIPYLEEVKQMYGQVLEEKQKLNTEQQARMPKIISEMEKLSKSAEKERAKVVKLDAEYEESQAENTLERLVIVVEEYINIQNAWMECKRELYGLEPQPAFPGMPDLPVLPRKLWQKIQAS